MDGFRKLVQKVDEDPAFGPLQAAKRFFFWSKFFDPVGKQVMTVNLSSMRYIFALDLLQKLVRRWAPDLRDDAESLLCSGSEGVLSAEMGRGIWKLAKEAKECKSVREILEKYKPEKVLAELMAEPEAKGFLDQLNSFLAKNGHRGLKELELQSARWEENPAPVLGMVRNYMLVETDPTEHEKRVDQSRAELEAEIRKKLENYPFERSLSLRWRLIRYVANLNKYFAKMRENSRFYHIMGFYIIRKKILRIEAELMRQGKLKCKGDIFSCTFLKLPGSKPERSAGSMWKTGYVTGEWSISGYQRWYLLKPLVLKSRKNRGTKRLLSKTITHSKANLLLRETAKV